MVKVFLNNREILEFDNVNNLGAEQIRTTLATAHGAIADTQYRWEDNNSKLYFYKADKKYAF